MQFIVECGIEYGLQIVTPFFLNLPNCLYTKKERKFFQRYEEKTYKQNNSAKTYTRMKKQMLAILLLLLPLGMTAQKWDLLKRD